MDNADKIDAQLTHKEVALFLGDELKSNQEETAVTYNLVEEYAKTAKNHRPFVLILLGICFFVIALGTTLTAGLVSKSNHKITINIDSFDDLNLRSLLNSVGRIQSLYESAVKNKVTLEQNLTDALNQAEQKRKMDLFTLESVASVASKDSINERKTRIDLDYNAAVQQIHSDYDERIKNAEEEILKYQNQVNEYNSAELSKARSAESSIDSTKQLNDIKMKTMEERYEKKIAELHKVMLAQQVQAAEEQRKAVEEVRKIYQAKIDLLDPKAREQSNEQDKIILDAGIKNKTANPALWKSVENLSFAETDYTSVLATSQFAETIRNTQKALAELRTIAQRFKPIPMENSIKDYVPAMMHQSYQIASNLAESGAMMQNDLEAYEVLAEQSLLSGADGIILSTKKAPDYTVYVSNLSRHKISETPTPVEILSNGRAAATGTIVKKDGAFILTESQSEANEVEGSATAYNPKTGDKFRFLSAR